jgi:hypothetical protein
MRNCKLALSVQAKTNPEYGYPCISVFRKVFSSEVCPVVKSDVCAFAVGITVRNADKEGATTKINNIGTMIKILAIYL